jgi:hypothetical protein
LKCHANYFLLLVCIFLMAALALSTLEIIHLNAVIADVRYQVSEEKLKMYEQVRTLATITSRADHELLLIRGMRKQAEEQTGWAREKK